MKLTFSLLAANVLLALLPSGTPLLEALTASFACDKAHCVASWLPTVNQDHSRG